ncbi:MAG: hypothetical protein WBP64_00755 [Nitrososphaeraceae archaeon]
MLPEASLVLRLSCDFEELVKITAKSKDYIHHFRNEGSDISIAEAMKVRLV